MSTKTKLSLKTITATKKIESPLAKYNSTGQLFCVLCNVHVKNEMYWTGHINGKAHRDQVILVKTKGKPLPTSSSIPQKRSIAPVSSASSIPQKRSAVPVSSASSIPQKRSIAPVSSASSSSSIASSSSSVSSDDGNGISSTTTGNFGNGETYLAPLHKRLKLEDLVVSPMGPPPSILKKTSYQPPRKKTFKEIEDEEAQMDVDSSIGSSSRIKFRNLSSPTIADDDDDDDDNEEGETEESSSGGTPTDALPAGFFDDAKQDAKARGLEYKNPDEAEWDKFVKEIASEDVKSSALRTADEEDSAKDRELDEIEEQMKNWQRVVELERKAKEAQRKLQQDKESKSEKMSTSDDEDIDEDYDDDLDWRTKKKN